MEKIDINTKLKDWNRYYRNVISDYQEMKTIYPFSCLSIPPTVNPVLATIRVVAANKELIDGAMAIKDDFLGEYSRNLYIEIPFDYRKTGCKVYGASWVDMKKYSEKDIHFYKDDKYKEYGYELCVGTPESFPLMKNVILENVRTAENMLIAYEKVMTGEGEKLELIAYAHSYAGRKQFLKNNKKYIPRS